MVDSVHIQNFKSIHDLSFKTTRINLFIGEPNTGKSNLIEGLALLSNSFDDKENFRKVLRFHAVADLFHNQQVTNPIRVRAGERSCSLQFNEGSFEFKYSQPGQQNARVQINQSGNYSNWVRAPEDIRFYRFDGTAQLNYPGYGTLRTPFGGNLVTLVYTNKELRRRISDLFKTRGFRLEIKPVEMQLLLAKSVDDELYSFPYESISETWRRIIFYMALLETNQSATLLLDEPESNTFPFYTKYLAERIALDESNQFFITTHNPYLLGSIVEKAKMADVSVFITSMENFETKVKAVTGDKLSEIADLGSSVFFNLDKLLAA
ncbi:MAG TPA: AAA family ATPase [Verrucomicrobiae bacterium]|jgi:AAA15 family ATPase/GTPase